MRLFVAISPTAEVVGRIEAALGALRLSAPSARWVKAGGVHITLAFLGERAEADAPRIAEALSKAAAGHAPFELRFRGGGSFGRPSRPRVVWAGCEGDLEALSALHRDVSAALTPCGYVPEERDFNAHLTLGRAKEQGGDHRLAACARSLETADFGGSRIEEVTLYESRLSAAGAEYRAVHRARLGATR
jgi:RNA 2',3'-cyclic 3'-phosphodiesterase